MILLVVGCEATGPGAVEGTAWNVEFFEDCGVDSVLALNPGDTSQPGPCSDRGWGAIRDPFQAIHVREEGDDTWVGSTRSPLSSLEAALACTRRHGVRTIALGPGEFAASASLESDDGGGNSDDGLAIEGCGPGETWLVGDALDQPVVKVSGVQDLRIAGLGVRDGRDGLLFWQGSTATLADVHVVGARHTGVVVDGSATEIRFEGVDIRDTLPEGVDDGIGVSVGQGGLTWVGGTLRGSTGVGVLGDYSRLAFDNVEIDATSPWPDGSFGRGLQAQELSTVTALGLTVRDSTGIGVYFLRSVDVQMTNSVVDVVAENDCGWSDGIVATRGSSAVAVENYWHEFNANTVGGVSRAGIVLSGVTATVDGNDADPIYRQDDADVSGSDSWETLEFDLEWCD